MIIFKNAECINSSFLSIDNKSNAFQITISLDEKNKIASLIFNFPIKNNIIDLNDYELILRPEISKNIKEVFISNKEIFKSELSNKTIESLFNFTMLRIHYTSQLSDRDAKKIIFYQSFRNFLSNNLYSKDDFDRLSSDILEFSDEFYLLHEIKLKQYEKINLL